MTDKCELKIRTADDDTIIRRERKLRAPKSTDYIEMRGYGEPSYFTSGDRAMRPLAGQRREASFEQEVWVPATNNEVLLAIVKYLECLDA